MERGGGITPSSPPPPQQANGQNKIDSEEQQTNENVIMVDNITNKKGIRNCDQHGSSDDGGEDDDDDDGDGDENNNKGVAVLGSLPTKSNMLYSAPPIRYAGIHPPSAGERCRSQARAFLQQLFHCRSFRSLVLSLDLPVLLDRNANNSVKYDAILDLQKLFRDMETIENLPSYQECLRFKDDNLRVGVPIIRNMIMPGGAFQPSDSIYYSFPFTGIFTLLKESGEKGKSLLKDYQELLLIPRDHIFKCSRCGNITIESGSDVALRIPIHQSVNKWLQTSMVRLGHLVRNSSSFVACSRCRVVQEQRAKRVIYRVKFFPQILVIKLVGNSSSNGNNNNDNNNGSNIVNNSEDTNDTMNISKQEQNITRKRGPNDLLTTLELSQYYRHEETDAKMTYKLSGVSIRTGPTRQSAKDISYIRERGREASNFKDTWLRFSGTDEVVRVSEKEVINDVVVCDENSTTLDATKSGKKSKDGGANNHVYTPRTPYVLFYERTTSNNR